MIRPAIKRACGAFCAVVQFMVFSEFALAVHAAQTNVRTNTTVNEIPPETSFIQVDQFGYHPDAVKIAILSNPQQGFNVGDTYRPSSVYQIRDFATGRILLDNLQPQSWNEGATAVLSGDQGWWLDFSSFTGNSSSSSNQDEQEGDESDTNANSAYYIYDIDNAVRSFEFEISPHVYSPILKAAGRMFYYNRCGHNKVAPFAEGNWTYPGAAFEQQDSRARFYLTPNDTSTERNLTGGWFDAGDFNKYVTFATRPVHFLLWTVQENPRAIAGNHWNIPESNDNTLPDILHELKWELDWLMHMNDPDTGATILKIGSIDYDHNTLIPPDQNTQDPRYYSPTCTSASIAVAGMFAHASVVYMEFNDYQDYASDLLQRAEVAWAYVLPRLMDNTLEIECDDGTIKSGDADWSVELQRERALCAAIYLFQATGKSTYHDYIRQNIDMDGGLPLTDGYWDYYNMELNDALLLYTTLPGADTTIADSISSSIRNAVTNNWNDFYGIRPQADLYRGFLPEYYWGSNQQVASMGILNILMIKYDITDSKELNKSMWDRAEEQLHYLHGVNPLGMVHLTNMYNLGGDKCANTIYHGWFYDGSIFDSVLEEPYIGPSPGFLVGGSNQAYQGSMSPPMGQPPQKAYFDFNTGFPENSWEITEPAIYYQASYLRLIANFVSDPSVNTCPAKGTSCLRGIQDGNCNCVPGGTCPPAGTSCDDGDPNTRNDVHDGNCNCVGTRPSCLRRRRHSLFGARYPLPVKGPLP